MSKVEPTLRYGAEAVLHGATFDDALAEALRRVEETGATLVHAFEDERVIAGQGTIGLELAEQLPDLETLLLPIGGGGLASGIAIAMRALRRAFASSASHTERGEYHDRRRHRGQVPRRDDDARSSTSCSTRSSSSATRRSARRSRSCSSARSSSSRARARSASRRSLTGKVRRHGPGVRAALGREHRPDAADLGHAPRPRRSAGRILVIRSRLTDRPGELINCCASSREQRANIVAIEHRREGVALQVADVGIELTLITRNEEHCRRADRGHRGRGLPGRPAALAAFAVPTAALCVSRSHAELGGVAPGRRRVCRPGDRSHRHVAAARARRCSRSTAPRTARDSVARADLRGRAAVLPGRARWLDPRRASAGGLRLLRAARELLRAEGALARRGVPRRRGGRARRERAARVARRPADRRRHRVRDRHVRASSSRAATRATAASSASSPTCASSAAATPRSGTA